MMGDAMDDMAEGEGEQEETDELVSQVLDEIGVDLGQDLVAAPSRAGVGARAAAPAIEREGAGATCDPLRIAPVERTVDPASL